MQPSVSGLCPYKRKGVMEEGRNMMKRLLSLTLCAVLAATAVFSVPFTANAAEKGEYTDLDVTKGEYFSYFSYIHGGFVYSDKFFNIDGTKFDRHMALLSLNAAQMSLDTKRRGTNIESSRDLREFLTDNGFVDFEINDDYKNHIEDYDTAGVACARKTMKDGGKTYTVLAVIPRGATEPNEWPATLKTTDHLNDSDDSAGYIECKKKMIDFTKYYIDKYKISGDLKIWTTGFSRAAAFTNLFAADLVDFPHSTLETVGNKHINLERKNIHCYCFGTPQATTNEECRDSRYDCIHNVCGRGDIMGNFPFTTAAFDRYGQDHDYILDIAGVDPDKDPDKYQAKKAEMLAYLENFSRSTYRLMTQGQDPDGYTPYSIDAEALINEGQMVFIPDENSYLPKERGAYIDSIVETMGRIEAAGSVSGDNIRNGYFSNYQDSAIDFMAVLMNYNFSPDAIMGSESGIPMLLGMYVTVLADKCKVEFDINLAAETENAFNQLARAIEDENGNVKEQYAANTDLTNHYYHVRETYFEPKDDEGIYRLKDWYKKTSISTKKAFEAIAEAINGYAAEMYCNVMTEYLTSKEAPQSIIDSITDPERSKATTRLLGHLFFDNVEQTSILPELKPVDISGDTQEEIEASVKAAVADILLNSQQFKQMATLMNNYQRLMIPHYSDLMNAWISIDDEYYGTFVPTSNEKRSGYRRVYIKQPDGVKVSGTVTDGEGNTVATFENGVLKSSTDQWVRITTCEYGDWLRLPCEKTYYVTLKNDKACAYSIKLEEYSVQSQGVACTIDGDGSWRNYKVSAGSTINLKVPELTEKDERARYYVMPSGVEYTLSKGEPPVSKPAAQAVKKTTVATAAEIVSASIPAAKSVKAKAAKKSFTVKWKKLSKKQRKAFSKVEVQYSTDPSFSSGATSVRTLSNTKKSLKIKRLAKGSVYYVRVRNIGYSGGSKIVSGWSAVKRAKVK